MLFMETGGIIIALHHEQNIFKIAKHRTNFPIIKHNILIGVNAISVFLHFLGSFQRCYFAAAFQEKHTLFGRWHYLQHFNCILYV